MTSTGRSVAVITGGTKGLGRAVAQRLLSEGYDLLLTYGSDVETAKNCQAELLKSAPGASVVTIQADAASFESVNLIADAVGDNFAGVGALILNAGLTDRGDLEDLEPERWNRVMDANVNVPVFLIQALVPLMKPGASIVFTGSSMGTYPHSMSLAYGVSKSAVHSLVKNLVKFLAPKQIRVNGVAPGFVDTEWQKTKPSHIRDSINSKISLGRFAEPVEIADAYFALISNPYFNGEVLSVDGGYSYR